MAAPAIRLSCTAFAHTSKIPVRRKQFVPTQLYPRHYNPSPRRNLAESNDDDSTSGTQESHVAREPPALPTTKIPKDERTLFNYLSNEDKTKWSAEHRRLHEILHNPSFDATMMSETARAAQETEAAVPHYDLDMPKIKPGGFWSMGEEDEQIAGDEEFEHDDITSHGHGELEQHREMRSYARIMAWEMPLLSKLAKPFEPPAADEPLRFRYTTYMGESHPAQKKIVVEFCTSDLRELSEAQRLKFVKLVGSRYNPETDVVKMSSEMFETQAQNKRYLGDLVDTLIAEAKNEKDMFEDVPLDFRHHRFKKQHEFPEGWKLRPARREQLALEREQRILGEKRREKQGGLVNGEVIIEEARAKVPVKDSNRVLVEAQRGQKGAVRRRSR
ncbi:37S ribosomal protein S24, mitochondrial [Puttea exsequens]|nr:37S ribosomal protein S24, mitochondrial [Puttea exsequens]